MSKQNIMLGEEVTLPISEEKYIICEMSANNVRLANFKTKEMFNISIKELHNIYELSEMDLSGFNLEHVR